MADKDSMCPSAPFSNDSFLLGTLNSKGEVSYLGGPIHITEEMQRVLNNLNAPEKHFRFTSMCLNQSCGQWSQGKCSVGARLSNSDVETKPSNANPPECGIRAACRWFKQEGPKVCGLCQFIVTDVSEDK